MKEDVVIFNEEELGLTKAICKLCTEEDEWDKRIDIRYIRKYSPEDILSEREERVYRQQSLIGKYKGTLIVIRVNYPGTNKNNYISFGILKEISALIIAVFKNVILYKNFEITAEGPIVTMVLNESCNNAKNKTVEIEENHLLGRCVDIDVYDENGNSLSRRELGLSERKCYLCCSPAQNCVRSRKHSIDEIENFMRLKYQQFCDLSTL